MFHLEQSSMSPKFRVSSFLMFSDQMCICHLFHFSGGDFRCISSLIIQRMRGQKIHFRSEGVSHTNRLHVRTSFSLGIWSWKSRWAGNCCISFVDLLQTEYWWEFFSPFHLCKVSVQIRGWEQLIRFYTQTISLFVHHLQEQWGLKSWM